MTKEEVLKVIANVVGYGIVGHGLDLVRETLDELDPELAATVKTISDEVYKRFDLAARQLENLEG